MRRFVKQALAVCLYYSGILRVIDWLFIRLSKSHDICVLMYHRVMDNSLAAEEFTQAGITVSTQTFRKQIEYLVSRYQIISTRQHLASLKSAGICARRQVVITFDDGWRDNIENAMPILRSYKAPATIFVCSDFVGSNLKFWFHSIGHHVIKGRVPARDVNTILCDIAGESFAPLGDNLSGSELLDRLLECVKQLSAEKIELLVSQLELTSNLHDTTWTNERFSATWDNLRQLDPALITIGSHGCSHRLLTAISRDQASKELSESKRRLETELDLTIETFAYPNGAYDNDIKVLVERAGYHSAYAVGESRGKADLFALGRIGVHEGATLGFGNKFSPALLALLLSPTLRYMKSQSHKQNQTGY